MLCAYPLGHGVLATLRKCEKCRKGLHNAVHNAVRAVRAFPSLSCVIPGQKLKRRSNWYFGILERLGVPAFT